MNGFTLGAGVALRLTRLAFEGGFCNPIGKSFCTRSCAFEMDTVNGLVINPFACG